jgi:hypothetical protein
MMLKGVDGLLCFEGAVGLVKEMAAWDGRVSLRLLLLYLPTSDLVGLFYIPFLF